MRRLLRGRLSRAMITRIGRERSGAALGENVTLAPGTRLTEFTEIDSNVWINGPADFKGSGRISIGSWTAIGHELIIATSDHDMRHPNMVLTLHRQHGFVDLKRSGPVAVGPGSWIGDRVVILGGASIGAGCVIAAGSVVTRGAYPPYSVLAGNPARVVRRRASEDVVEALCASEWWLWDFGRIARNRAFFESDISCVSAAELTGSIRA